LVIGNKFIYFILKAEIKDISDISDYEDILIKRSFFPTNYEDSRKFDNWNLNRNKTRIEAASG
jgi:hypothetical protein